MEQKTNPITVLIVDDHDLMRECIRTALQSVADIEVVGEASSGEEAIEFTRNTSPAVILMDMKMPGIGGLEATRYILQRQPQIKIIAITSCDEEPFPSWFRDAGGHGFLTKDCSMEEVVQAIHDVSLSEDCLNQAPENQVVRNKLSKQKSLLTELTQRELQIMFMLCSGAKVKDIAKKLFISSKTVNAYRYRLHEKLNVQNDVELTRLALRYGLLNRDIFSDENSPE